MLSHRMGGHADQRVQLDGPPGAPRAELAGHPTVALQHAARFAGRVDQQAGMGACPKSEAISGRLPAMMNSVCPSERQLGGFLCKSGHVLKIQLKSPSRTASGSGPPRTPVSIASIAATSSV
jgi:hypothetical protein